MLVTQEFQPDLSYERTSMLSPSRMETMGPANSPARAELASRSVRGKAQRQRMDRMLAGLSRHGEKTTIGVSVGCGFGSGANPSIRFPRHDVLESFHGRKREYA